MTPEEIHKLYEEGLTGVIYDEGMANAFLSSLPTPFFSQINTLFGDGKGRLSLPWKAAAKFHPEFGADEAQVTGDCVSHGNRGALDITRCVEIIEKGEKEIYLARGATEGIYGCRGHGGQGMQGFQAAEFLTKSGGLLVRQNYTDLNLDLSKYSANIGINWGSRGIPSNVLEEAKKHQLKTASLVTSVEEARDLVANGYGIAVCSNYGFSSVRDKFGIAEAGGTWNHCYKEQTIIYSPYGYRNIKDYKVGDSVFDHNGDIQKVTNIFERDYNGEIVKISSYGLPDFDVTLEHPILVLRDCLEFKNEEDEDTLKSGIIVIKNKNKKTKIRKLMFVPAKDIKVGDWLVTPKTKYSQESFTGLDYGKITSNTINIPKQLDSPDEDVAWLFGFFIGDGNVVENHKICFTFNSKENHLLNRLEKSFEKIGLQISHKTFGNYTRAYCYSSVLSRAFIKWFGKYSTERQIPEFLFSQGWNLNSVIEGIYDADGFNVNGTKKISMSNKNLIFQIRNILINQDKNPTIFKQERFKGYDNGSPLYTITISDRTRYFTKNHLDYFCNPVRKITTYVENCKVYNLEVSNSHTYIADGVASHNCMTIGGVDDTKTRSNEILFLIINSWGPNWISGPKYEQPDGSFWIRERVMSAMLAQRQTYALADFNGFRRRMAWKIKDIYA